MESDQVFNDNKVRILSHGSWYANFNCYADFANCLCEFEVCNAFSPVSPNRDICTLASLRQILYRPMVYSCVRITGGYWFVKVIYDWFLWYGDVFLNGGIRF